MIHRVRNAFRILFASVMFWCCLPAVALTSGCATTGQEIKPAEVATTGIVMADELCSLDLSSAPTVVEAAKKYGAKAVEYARKICKDAKLAAPYAQLLEQSGETGDLVSPLEEARQRAIERGKSVGVL